jgi:hypothetical protein
LGTGTIVKWVNIFAAAGVLNKQPHVFNSFVAAILIEGALYGAQALQYNKKILQTKLRHGMFKLLTTFCDVTCGLLRPNTDRSTMAPNPLHRTTEVTITIHLSYSTLAIGRLHVCPRYRVMNARELQRGNEEGGKVWTVTCADQLC